MKNCKSPRGCLSTIRLDSGTWIVHETVKVKQFFAVGNYNLNRKHPNPNPAHAQNKV